MSQPTWKLIANLGDANPIDHGGIFVYVDVTGAYSPEVEVLEEPTDDEGDNGTWTAYRFELTRCTFIDGILSDNAFHPDHPAWFADKLAQIASTCDTPLAELIADLCGERGIACLANAWTDIGRVEGLDNLDHDPLTFARRIEVMRRYATDDERSAAEAKRAEFEAEAEGPGKFEGVGAYAAYYWDQYLNGFSDDDERGVLRFDVTDEDRLIFPDLDDVDSVYLYEDDNGFICDLGRPAEDDEYFGHDAEGYGLDDDEPTDDDDEPTEPEEGDWVTEDHRTFVSHGSPRDRFTVPDGYDWETVLTVLRARMDADRFWPNVWFISDHGNAHLILVATDEERASGAEVMPTFSVIEYASFYAVRHNPTGQEHAMGDGVDTLFDDDGEALSPGTESFRKSWEEDLNRSAHETLEAYFPDLS